MPRLPTHSLITRAVRAEPTRVRHRKGATTAPSPLFLSQPSYPLSLSPTWLPPKCPSLFNQAIPLASIVSPFILLLNPDFPHTPPHRSFDPEREAFPKYYKSQCRPCLVQNKDDCTQSTPLQLFRTLPLIFPPSCIASGPTQERLSPVRRWKFKVQRFFCSSNPSAHRPS